MTKELQRDARLPQIPNDCMQRMRTAGDLIVGIMRRMFK